MSNTIEDESVELINDIQNLQNIELDLFDTLEKGIANNTLTDADKTALIDQINKVSKMRVNLFNTLNGMNQYYQGTVSSTGNVLTNQLNALQVVENELNDATTRLNIINDEKNNKQRMVEINTYYSERYADHKSIMQVIVMFCIPIIILTVLANMHILPRIIYAILLSIILVIAIIVVGIKLIMSVSHDNMNYQEYVWGSKNNPPTNTVDTSDSTGTNPWYTTGLECVGQQCCQDGFTYVPAPTNMCVANVNLPEGVAPYNPNQAVSVTTGASSSTGTSSFMGDIANSTTNLTSAASGIATTADNSVASVYNSLSNSFGNF